MPSETIAAISTAPGRGGVAVVRVSGGDAFAVCAALTGRKAKPGRIMVCDVLGEECVVLAFRAPHSYTGEDVIEFQCHGGFVAPRRILDETLRCGARLAGPGEFTRRAFLNGRIGYEAAQAVIDLIDAKTDQAAEAALAGLAGETTRRLRSCYDAALDISSRIEHSLDIDEGELPDGFIASIHADIAALIDKFSQTVRSLRTRAILRHGALVVLAGEPNAGKSSLFNALVRENRAIVSAVAGTTRDAIEAWLDIGGWPVRLVDTAGLRESADEIEAEGVRRSGEYIAKADIVLALSPASAPPHMDNPHCATIAISAKCDLKRGSALNVSAVTGEGLDELRTAIAGTLEILASSGNLQDGDGGEEAVSAVNSAQSSLLAAQDAADDDLVLVANAVRTAAETLGRHIGAEYSADMLDRLFSRFCVGK